MSKIYCKNYSSPGNDNNIAVKICDSCEAPLCKYCGYIDKGADYCNEFLKRLTPPIPLSEVKTIYKSPRSGKMEFPKK